MPTILISKIYFVFDKSDEQGFITTQLFYVLNKNALAKDCVFERHNVQVNREAMIIKKT